MNMTDYFIDENNRFVIEDFSNKLPFSSFLPGIAGKIGIPLWVFYVNRGQAIASFGVKDKDSPIMEFQPANKAYRITPYEGFLVQAVHSEKLPSLDLLLTKASPLIYRYSA